jgi:hypothetical protein
MVSLIAFSPFDTGEGTEFISATDILKNFRFETFANEPIVADGAKDNKVRFDTQAAWVLYKDDVIPLNMYEIGESTQLKYRIVLRNKINIYTNVRLNQMAESIQKYSEDFLAVKYRHNSLGGGIDYWWEQYIHWDHYNFGDIRHYNSLHNDFSGQLVMSFDINDNPVPASIGPNTETEFGYIAVSDAGIVSNKVGLMNDEMPDIVDLAPSEYEAPDDAFSLDGQGRNAYEEVLDPMVSLNVYEYPVDSFDGGVVPDTAGGSLNPRGKDGRPIWDPETQESMTGCLLHYDVVRISPVVYLWKGHLSWTFIDLETEKYLEYVFPLGFKEDIKTNHRRTTARDEFRDAALHGINRFIHVDMYVAFDIWTSVKLGTLTDEYEQLRLEDPEEYYEDLIWSTIVGGWTGSTIEHEEKEWGWSLESFFDIFGGIGGFITFIIVLGVVLFGGYLFFMFGIPYLKAKQARKHMIKRRRR